MTGNLNMNENHVKNTLDPINEQDAVNKRYLEAQLTDYVKTNRQNPMFFNLNMNGYKIENLRDTDSSSVASEAVNNKYVDEGLNTKLNVIAERDLNMNNNGIINVACPLEREDVTNKQYVDDQLSSRRWVEQDACQS